VWAAPHETLQQVYAKMKMFDVSQVPVMEGSKLIGLMDETDILLTVTGNQAGFQTTVGKVMRQQTETLDVKSPMTDLLPVFERCRAACVTDKGQFLGLITPIDFLNYLRKRTGQA
jgi:cystathionine beta-synthase